MDNPYATPHGEIDATSSDFTPLTWKQILFSFQGRIARRQYWAAILLLAIAAMVNGSVAAFVSTSSETLRQDPRAVASVVRVFWETMIPFIVFGGWSGFAVQAKRWHDRDKFGWWFLIGFVPFIGGIWQLIECGCLRGTEGPNRYGGDPT